MTFIRLKKTNQHITHFSTSSMKAKTAQVALQTSSSGFHSFWAATTFTIHITLFVTKTFNKNSEYIWVFWKPQANTIVSIRKKKDCTTYIMLRFSSPTTTEREKKNYRKTTTNNNLSFITLSLNQRKLTVLSETTKALFGKTIVSVSG